MQTWRARLRRMRGADYLTAIEVVSLAIWMEVALRVMPFSRLLDGVGRASSSHAVSKRSGDLQRLSRFVTVAYEILPFPPTCLRRSLVLHALLVRRRIDSRLCVGVARIGSALTAHAWVESNGATSDAAAAGFRELTPASKELAHVVDQELRLLQGGEVPASGHVRQLL